MSVAAEQDRQISPHVAACIAEERIPVIDVSGYLAGDPDAVAQFAADLRAIQESLGFYCIVNHGVDQALIDRSFELIADLFALSDDDKMKYRVDFHHQGFIPNKSLILRWSKIAKNEKKDLNEAWAFMRERTADDPKVKANTRHRNLNQWPKELPEFRTVLLEYQETMAVLATRMLPAYARALELPTDYFDEKFAHPEYYNRCAWYPPVE
ncbi:MAG: 2-oxoglutarate and iron-dependent oxygenase domain-containing protein, partial [Alphaproteobacteria bacterium]|nr:2-oxoglutarate and iron-dependent oxygenase domain-containing protein [Alphaproteobacteria bacterium]